MIWKIFLFLLLTFVSIAGIAFPIVEKPGSLLFVNAGRFIPGSVESVLNQDAPQQHYLNRLLTEAMVNLNMIDTIGSGIKRMFTTQKSRYMPMPDFDLSNPHEIRVSHYRDGFWMRIIPSY